jgi:SAM-dependent methyltransferase
VGGFADKFLVTNLIYTHESNLPYFEIISAEGKVNGIRVFRSGAAQRNSIYYHRTARGIKELLDADGGELNYFLKNSQKFILENRQKKILDLGCGDGNLVFDLKKIEKTMNITGIDLYLSAKQKESPAFLSADAFALPFAQNSFDLILSTWSVFTYEPLGRLSQLLVEAMRVLQSNGSLIIGPFLEMEQMAHFFRCAQRLKLITVIDPKSNVFLCKKAPISR